MKMSDKVVPQTFDQVFLQHHTQIYRVIYRIVGNQAEAEDLTQETFLRLHDHFEKLELERVYHWLHRVAVNFGLKAIRGRKRWFAWHQKAKNEGQIQKRQDNPDPVQGAEVRELLAALPERQAQLLLLHAAGFSYEELAEATGVKRSSISQLLARARKAFEQGYQQREGQRS